MGAYLVRRLLLMALTLFGMSILIFVMLRLVPGNIADILVDAAGIADSKEKAKIIHELGLDRPIIEQYGQWIGGLSRGDLGFAYVSEPGHRGDRAAYRSAPSWRAWPVLRHHYRHAGRRHQRGGRTRTRLLPSRAQSQRPVGALVLLGLLVLMAAVNWFGTIPIYSNDRAACCRSSGCWPFRRRWSGSAAQR
jgi:peptide/nickel transport system permease protein